MCYFDTCRHCIMFKSGYQDSFFLFFLFWEVKRRAPCMLGMCFTTKPCTLNVRPLLQDDCLAVEFYT